MHYLDWFADSTMVVTDLALACCGVESGLAVPLKAKSVVEPPAGARRVVVVSGTISSALAPAVVDAIGRIAEDCARCAAQRPVVLAFGACACGGGPYWDSLPVLNGMDALPTTGAAPIPVDRWIPGCPPPARELARVIDEIHRQTVAGAA
ncbi:proton-conducting membrane transporter [Acidipropionibacterium virtanenii]|uniref:NADH-quinone oxidoreductase subunit B n=1 Tax=Acidipropionibacterium virtanenii TaxID=2057246 RepID=A0A344US43_9ACTN|nr:proton-conducting membrane transporter [Acidipropionibacterium virtanenii]AXE38091.1 NADH-quinone oxidoreductase subunit B [Acidipropionibacterium virtanenii]